ncbi:MAG: MerR family transcriptional regulator [Candidatus Omnitrophica bacterium]|nr:MerR family transcriptional regulator [Candidatus Omnitrophota bacterium]MBU4302800.1 MerR family transcriptional regulator [Candidatus Omnitrophota bacterium]MBU4418612.1 MerR family transcriptional regulator [Candidatus Omnitrophota bacterium]MBU4467147.1 MerR family transcriptional regulator [Candidatus Omnitrophota bacterium]MCG2714559.1 MerR family transcriptional regulator [Candidatus Omnitrophota bacterium]
MSKTLISPAEISKIYSISYQTVNYYTNLGLLVVKKRNANNRLYDARQVSACLKKVTNLKSQGYSLKLICDLLRKG